MNITRGEPISTQHQADHPICIYMKRMPRALSSNKVKINFEIIIQNE